MAVLEPLKGGLHDESAGIGDALGRVAVFLCESRIPIGEFIKLCLDFRFHCFVNNDVHVVIFRVIGLQSVGQNRLEKG
jgi:hypothetical protein